MLGGSLGASLKVFLRYLLLFPFANLMNTQKVEFSEDRDEGESVCMNRDIGISQRRGALLGAEPT